jgi:hypothetical protein
MWGEGNVSSFFPPISLYFFLVILNKFLLKLQKWKKEVKIKTLLDLISLLFWLWYKALCPFPWFTVFFSLGDICDCLACDNLLWYLSFYKQMKLPIKSKLLCLTFKLPFESHSNLFFLPSLSPLCFWSFPSAQSSTKSKLLECYPHLPTFLYLLWC